MSKQLQSLQPIQQFQQLSALTLYHTEEDKKRLKFIIDQIAAHSKNTDKRVLEIGCGNGNMSKAIAYMGYQVLGIDIDDSSIKWANEHNDLPNLEFRVQPAEELTQENFFDIIVCTEVLEHLHDPSIVLKYVSGNLKDDGIFISTVPNGRGPREVLMTKPMQNLQKNNKGEALKKVKKVFGFGNGTVQSSNPDLEHIQFFNKSEIIKLHEQHGLSLLNFNHADFIRNVFPYSILTRRSNALQKIDCKIADRLPSACTSGFYMAYTKAN